MSEQSLKPVIEKLESLFSKFNERFYDGELQKPIITVSPDGRGRSYGWCTAWRAWSDSGKNIDASEMSLQERIKMENEGFYEINICAEYLSRSLNDVAETLLHEMVHLYNLQFGISDTSRSGTYHNKNYKKSAEEHGLIAEKDKKYGWTRTKLSDSTKEYVESLGISQFMLCRRFQSETNLKKQSVRKYVCPICECKVRATKTVRIICANCNVPFIEIK